MTTAALQPWPWRTAVLLFVASIFFLGRQLDFHGYVHDDEPNKVTQITKGKYNFNHPLLMLHSVKLYAVAAGISGDYDRVIRAGRWSSVIFSSLALAMLVLLSGRLHGAFVAAVAGVFILTIPIFFELAHYFKEEPALIFGLSLSLVAMQIYSEKPTFGRAAVLGAACGVAISGKYAGLMIFPFALYVVLSARRAKDLLVFALFAAGAFCLINWPMVTSPEVWQSRVDREVTRLQADGAANRRQVPHVTYFSVFGKNTSPVILGLLAIYLWSAWQRKFRLSPVEWVMIAMPTLYLVLISFIPTTSERYVLPSVLLLTCVAAAGLSVVLSWPYGRTIALVIGAAAIAWQIPELRAHSAAFASRRHDEVISFLRSGLPPSSSVLVDNYNSLGPPDFADHSLKQRRLQPGETLESLQQAGFTHILVTSKRYRVFAPDSRSSSGLSVDDQNKMRSLYDEISARCRIVSEWKAGKKKMLEPEFRLYELPR